MQINEYHVAKVVPERIFSVAIHPTENTVLLAAGDKWGKIGLWDMVCDGLLLFKSNVIVNFFSYWVWHTNEYFMKYHLFQNYIALVILFILIFTVFFFFFLLQK